MESQQSKVVSAPPGSPAGAVTAVKRRPSLDFSMTGLLFCAMMMFMGLAAINTQANLLYGVFGLMIGVLLVSGVVSRRVIKSLIVTRLLPDSASVGQPTTIVYQFTNQKTFWPSFSVQLAELDGCQGFDRQPFAYMLHAAPHTTATVPTEVMPKRRGLYKLDRYQALTSFPFGFIKRATIVHQPDSLVILPALARVDARIVQLASSAERTGASTRPRRGGDDEFYGLTEFRTGDNPRAIYWKRSARTGILVKREMTRVSPPRFLIVVDAFAADEEHQHLAERAIAQAASLASWALDNDMPVGLVAGAPADDEGDPFVRIALSRGKRHRRDVLTALAQIQVAPAPRTGELGQAAAGMMEAGCSVFLFSPAGFDAAEMGIAAGRWVSIVPQSATDRFFAFDPSVNFTHCAPLGDVT